MEFDISKVYTAINADKLPAGSRIYAADKLAPLKDLVMHDVPSTTLQYLRTEDWACRFVAADNNGYALTY